MGKRSGNFEFLTAQDERLARLGALAERYFYDDAPAALIKLRQLAEFMARAWRHRTAGQRLASNGVGRSFTRAWTLRVRRDAWLVT